MNSIDQDIGDIQIDTIKVKEVVQRCVDIIREHCEQSRERGLIPDPATMIRLLDNYKKEL